MGVGCDVPPSLSVVEAVAERKGVDAMELSPPLESVIDSDALDALFCGALEEATGGRVRFSYLGYTVVVDAAGDVTVES